MKLYKIEGHGKYAGGVVLVAAYDAEQAANLGNRGSGPIWRVVFKPEDAIEMHKLKYTGRSPQVILHYETGE